MLKQPPLTGHDPRIVALVMKHGLSFDEAYKQLHGVAPSEYAGDKHYVAPTPQEKAYAEDSLFASSADEMRARAIASATRTNRKLHHYPSELDWFENEKKGLGAKQPYGAEDKDLIGRLKHAGIEVDPENILPQTPVMKNAADLLGNMTPIGSPAEILEYRKLLRNPAYWYARHVRTTPPEERQADVVAAAPTYGLNKQPVFMTDEQYKTHNESFMNLVNKLYGRR